MSWDQALQAQSWDEEPIPTPGKALESRMWTSKGHLGEGGVVQIKPMQEPHYTVFGIIFTLFLMIMHPLTYLLQQNILSPVSVSAKHDMT